MSPWSPVQILQNTCVYPVSAWRSLRFPSSKLQKVCAHFFIPIFPLCCSTSSSFHQDLGQGNWAVLRARWNCLTFLYDPQLKLCPHFINETLFLFVSSVMLTQFEFWQHFCCLLLETRVAKWVREKIVIRSPLQVFTTSWFFSFSLV